MTEPVAIAFDLDRITVKLEQLVPSKAIPSKVRSTIKFRQIAESINEVGLVEPIIVHQMDDSRRQFMIVDGHLRILALEAAGAESVECIVANDDENFTYNKHLNRLSSVQEHYMILRAIKNGVSEERIARALGVHVKSIRRKRDLLRDICPEVVEILKHTSIPAETARYLRKFSQVRQIEVAELMIAANNTSSSYAKALYMATNPSQLRDTERKRVRGLTDAERRNMEVEMESIQRDIRNVENNYGANMLRLVVANGYIGRLLASQAVSRYLHRNHNDLLEQLLLLQDSIDADIGVLPE